MILWPLLVVVVIAAGLVMTDAEAVGADAEQVMRLVYLGVLGLGLLVAGLGRLVLAGAWRSAHYAITWCAVAVGLVAAYGEQELLQGHVAELRARATPSMSVATVGIEERLERGWDGHYRAEAQVNGRPADLMVDTGASMVVLPFEEVARLGIDPESLDFVMPVSTANGRSTVAPIVIEEIRVGEIVVREVDAAVAHPGRLHTGLLGMSFLDRLTETSFRGRKLYLRQNRVTAVPTEASVERED
ncbi:MAG: TIGR02281 family clan AA aspartic protease [Paracoccaceae bacterium]